MVNPLDFTGKQILITGAAIGIGKETAVLLDKLGAKVILIDKNENGLKEMISCLEGKGHLWFRHDLSDVDGILPKIKEIISICGALDGFVHCVGIRCRRPLSMITPVVLNEVISLNFGSFVELIRCITKKDHFNKGLSIVGISSVSSQRGGTGVTAYAASKAAMDGAVRCLAKELAPKSIRLNTVVPSQINTPAYADLLKINEETEDATLSRQYLGLGEPIDVANVITFLLSDSSRFITGSAIPVDGGFLSS
jgi:NAD(P)-dependent dehydrogenase (short-subunit alcohol dehydrogenase family)